MPWCVETTGLSKYVLSQGQGQLPADIQVASSESVSVDWEEPCHIQVTLSQVLRASKQDSLETWFFGRNLPLATLSFRARLAGPQEGATDAFGDLYFSHMINDS